MNKEFEYNGYRFNIKVELNTKVEKRLNGGRWHTMTVNCMNHSNYYKKKEVQDELLRNAVIDAETQAIKYVDYKEDEGKSKQEKLLEELGFK